MGDDVGAEILLRLPAKAVLRCRAVCRSWRRITTTAYFVAAHSRRRPLQLLGYTGLAVDSSSSPYSYVFTVITSVIPAFCDGDDAGRRILLRRDMRVSLRGSCDGLLLFERNTGGGGDGGVLICNPATRQLVDLPPVETPPPVRLLLPPPLRRAPRPVLPQRRQLHPLHRLRRQRATAARPRPGPPTPGVLPLLRQGRRDGRRHRVLGSPPDRRPRPDVGVRHGVGDVPAGGAAAAGEPRRRGPHVRHARRARGDGDEVDRAVHGRLDRRRRRR
ncbi:Os02g0130800 [Oryza sativa Japonica Group]|uniref:Os02g0130800 protein n=1 Tax=Oryza sativa subsp. japonica TaxID=39947 RepID=A0A0P0VEH0_ORYSJ|nr:hypothetical protein EE612_008656 [Oryza sativa]BAS76811.1 Os02g0130800 [Oryza sativa Japonica Group]